jgi:Phosphoglucomutase/phosphomannomutase, alpha/beta/alpha domain I
MEVSKLAGKPADPSVLINVPRLVTAYYTGLPDPGAPAQRVVFGTSGHRGSALDNAFNEAHILAITQAICLYRKQQGIDGPLYIGIDTHALSEPAFTTRFGGAHVGVAEAAGTALNSRCSADVRGVNRDSFCRGSTVGSETRRFERPNSERDRDLVNLGRLQGMPSLSWRP